MQTTSREEDTRREGAFDLKDEGKMQQHKQRDRRQEKKSKPQWQ